MMIPTEQRDRLTALLSPFSRDVFLTSYYEREPLHVERDDPSYFADVFSVAELENILVAGSGDRSGFNMVRSGVPPVNAELLAMERPGVRARFTGKARRTSSIRARSSTASTWATAWSSAMPRASAGGCSASAAACSKSSPHRSNRTCTSRPRTRKDSTSTTIPTTRSCCRSRGPRPGRSSRRSSSSRSKGKRSRWPRPTNAWCSRAKS